MSKDCLRVGVVGAGVMGSHHARVYAQLPDVELVGISDTALAKAEALVAQYGGTAYADFREFIQAQAPDALSICVPTASHAEVAIYAAQHGVHLLIEKPIAISATEGQRIVQQAQSAGICLAVGHIERFNPAVIHLKRHINRGTFGKVVQIDARRMGPYPQRIRDVGVVFDLAIHDLDIIHYLCESDVTRIFAEVQWSSQHDHEDSMAAHLHLANGALCNVSVSWRAPFQIRDLTLMGEKGIARLNYLTQQLQCLGHSAPTQAEFANSCSGLQGPTPLPEQPDPLQRELAAFIAAIRGEEAEIVTGEDGLRALTLAQAIIEAGQR